MNPGRHAPTVVALALLLALVLVVGISAEADGPRVPGRPAGEQSPPQTEAPAPTEVAHAAVPLTPAASRTPALPTPTPLRGETPPQPSPTALPRESQAEPGQGTATPSPAGGAGSPLPSATPLPPQEEAQAGQGVVFGTSVEGRPLVAHRLGKGAIKVVLVGDIHGGYEANTQRLVKALLDQFSPEGIPERVSLWLIDTLNPDGLAAGTRWNAHGVDLNRNADTDLDGCAGNDWSPDTVGSEGSYPGAGGPYPFSEPETRALRDFLADAQVAVFYHSAAGAIYADSCQRHVPSARLAQALSEGSGYPIPEDGWTGYRITGDFGDYLAGEGVAAVTVELTDHEGIEREQNVEGVRSLLAQVDRIVAADAEEAGGELVWLDSAVCAVPLARGSLVHPLAVEVIGDAAYLLDSGRVLRLDLHDGAGSPCPPAGQGAPATPEVLLAPGSSVAGVRVIEPLDLAAGGSGDGAGWLLVLDRAGDVVRYDVSTGAWTLERYGRPAIDTGDHYYVALAALGQDGFLLETTREKVWRFTQGQIGSAWAELPLGRDVDLSATQEGLYVLTRQLRTPMGDLVRYLRSGDQAGKARLVPSFEPGIVPVKPRQVVAAGASVLVLDRAGRRLLELDPATGALRTEYRFADRRAVSAFWAAPAQGEPRTSQAGAGPELILAGRDLLYFYGGPGTAGVAEPRPDTEGADEGDAPAEARPNDPAWLESLRGLAMPIEGATVTRRDYQMPGSPRHYRLGVHQGIDFYTGTAGVEIDRRTPVHAVAAGTVVRALLDYQPLTAAQARAWAGQVSEVGYTPDDVLDGYRGMQVWIEHTGGLVSRYAHLSAIAPGIVVGARVEQGQVIGMVGNSGTPESVRNPSGELHLHLELWAGDSYVGQYLRPIEAREWIEAIVR